VQAAQQGDRAALERLLERYQERVRGIVRVRLGAQLRAQLESGDVLQQVLLDAFRSLDRFEPRDEAAFLAWLATIAENRIRDAADYHGSEKRDGARAVPLDAGPADDASIGPAPPVDGAPGPAEAAARSEQRRRHEDCLAELPEADREVVVLRDYIGLPWKDVAERVGAPSPDAARMRHAAVLVELGRRLRERGVR
jgi:RNA polymerase sigma-70 factor (ECF subfamily)